MKNGNLDFIYTFEELSKLHESFSVSKKDLVDVINTEADNAHGIDLESLLELLTPEQSEALNDAIDSDTKNVFELLDGKIADDVVADSLEHCTYTDGTPIMGNEETYFDDIDGGYDATIFDFLAGFPIVKAKLDSEENLVLVLGCGSEDMDEQVHEEFDKIER